jgi:hypothetical protein
MREYLCEGLAHVNQCHSNFYLNVIPVTYTCGLTTLQTRYCCFSYMHFVLIYIVGGCGGGRARVCVGVWVGVCERERERERKREGGGL